MSALVLGAGAAAGAAVVARTLKQWSSEPDPTEGTAVLPIEGHEKTVASPDGARISVTDGGNPSGVPIVMVHGWTEDRRVWSFVARRLAASGYRVVAYDQRGHARSTIGEAGYTIEALGDDLGAVLEALDLRDAVVAGHSMGGMAAQAFCIGHPEAAAERVRGLALVATAAGDLGMGTVRERQATRILAHPLLDRALANPGLAPLMVRGSVGRRPVRAHLLAVAEMFAATPAATRTGFLSAIGAMDLSEGIARFQLPVTIVVGTRDRLTPLASARKMAGLIPHAKLEVVPDAGHSLTYEAPDVVVKVIEELAAAAPGRSIPIRSA